MSPCVATIVRMYIGMRQKLDRKNASQTRGLAKGGSEVKPRRQEIFYWIHDKQKARYYFAQMR